MPPETDEDAIRDRLFELMPKYPSKDACKIHLRREGFADAVVERVVDETFALRKKVVMRRMTDEADQTRVLVSVLDGETARPLDVAELHPVAREYSKRLSRDSRALRSMLRAYLAVVVLGGIACVLWPQILVVVLAVTLRRPFLGAAIVAGVLGWVANAVNSFWRLRVMSERIAALRALASDERWVDLAV